MNDAQAAARLQRVEALCAASIRALVGDAELHFRAQRLHRGHEPVAATAPHLRPQLPDDDQASFRGAADGLALHLLHSDPALHRQLAPDAMQAPVARLIFDMLEQYRTESLPPPGLHDLPGLRQNLRHRFEAWSRQFAADELVEGDRGLLLFTLAQVCRARVCAEAIPDEHADLIEATRFALVPVIGHALAALRRTRHDQAAYAALARSIADVVADLVAARDDGKPFLVRDRDDPSLRGRFALLLNLQGAPLEGRHAAAGWGSTTPEDMATPYRVYSRSWDRTLPATALARRDELRQLREQLDARIARQGLHLARLARELKRLFAQPERDGWRGGEEDGRIDGARLAQLVASPAERRLFRTEPPQPVVRAVVSVLVDCSGSMKQHIEALAMWIDTLARALEMAGASCEVLGFSTSAWSGGRVARAWQRAGRPAHPGRLNETLHIVFKDAATPWRRARPGLAALLKADLFREGIDGEAVDWAAGRLLAAETGSGGGDDDVRRCLIVVSDGSPMDTATAGANGEHYLDAHLRQVVQGHERAGRLELSALGVGLDLSGTYSRSRMVDTATPSGHHVFREILELLAGRGWR